MRSMSTGAALTHESLYLGTSNVVDRTSRFYTPLCGNIVALDMRDDRLLMQAELFACLARRVLLIILNYGSLIRSLLPTRCR